MTKKSTRNAAGNGSIRKKTVRLNGKEYTGWEARITVGYDPGTGKQIQKSFSGKTQKEVREKMQAALVEVNNNAYFEPSKMLLSQWVAIWLEAYMGDKKYGTVKQYKAQCKAHIVPKLGATKLPSLTPPQIQSFYNDLQRNGLSAKSVRNIHGILTKCLSTAVSVGYLRDNPCQRVTLPKVQKAEITPLTDEQVTAFLKEAAGDEMEILLTVILFTGLRESEALGLTWDCVNFDVGTLKINKQLQKRPLRDGGFVFAPLKNDKSRTVHAATFVMDLLRRRKREQAEQRLLAGSAWEGWTTTEEAKKALVFTNALGKNFTQPSVVRHYKKIAARIGAPNSRVHDLRHTFAVLSLQNGDDVKTVQDNLGHATAAFTLDVYGHASKRMKEESAARMQNYIESVSTL